jgi:ribosome-binding protein aMBF1 (putative translation factor)
MEHQDWAPLTISSKGAVAKKATSAAPVKVSADAAHKRKIADADAPIKLKQLSAESRQNMIQVRTQTLKKTQAELNQLCQFPPNTIRDVEAGKLTPSGGQLNVLSRVLKISLKLS